MSASNELTRKIIEFIHSSGSFAWRASSVGLYDSSKNIHRTAPKKGVSDVLGIIAPSGRTLAVEIKIGKDRLSDEQTGFLANIEHYGGLSFVAKDFDSFVNFWQNTVKGG